MGVMKKGKMETFMRQTGYLRRPPTSTQPPEILHAGSCLGSSYIFQVSWKSVAGSQSCWGRNSPCPIETYGRRSRDTEIGELEYLASNSIVRK